MKSGKEPLPLKLPVDRAGVYVVELQANDRLGRAQVVSVDLYVGGDQPVAWPKPVTPVFSVALDGAPLRPGRHGRPHPEEPLPDRPRALHRGGARGQPLLLARGRERRRHLPPARGGPLHAARARALRPHAGPAAQHRSPARQQHRPRQARDPGRHRLGGREPGGEPGRGRAPQPRDRAAGTEDRGDDSPQGPEGRAAARRGDAVAGGRGGAGPGPRAAPRSAAGLPAPRGVAPRGARHPQPGPGRPAVRGEPGRRRGDEGGGAPRPRHRAQELQVGALLRSRHRGGAHGGRHRDRAAARRPHELQAPGQGRERAGAVRGGDVAGGGAAAGDRPARAAALRPAGRPLHRRRGRPRGRGRGRAGHGRGARRGRRAAGPDPPGADPRSEHARSASRSP